MRRIVFLYDERDAPDEIVSLIETSVPSGFALQSLRETSAAEHRLAILSDAEFVLGYPGNLTAREIDAAQRLKLLQLLGAGYEHVALARFAERGIPVANNGGANAPTVAEHALLLMLAVLRKLPLHHNALMDGRWIGADETMRLRELGGKTVGIIGFGRIGQAMARLLTVFGTQTLYHDVRPAPPDGTAALNAQPCSLEELLRRSDIVSVHTSLDEGSRHLLDGRALALMKPTAILVNVSRGAVVDEAALVERLASGALAGAGLDVFEREPLEADSRLRELDNVVLTPHYAGVSADTWTRRIAFGFENVLRVARGEPAASVVP